MSAQSDRPYVLDRFEEGAAVLIPDRGEPVSVPGLVGREGDVFVLREGCWVPDDDERQAREQRIRGKMDRLFGKRD